MSSIVGKKTVTRLQRNGLTSIHALLNCMDGFGCARDSHGHYIGANEAFCHEIARTCHVEVLGKSIREIHPKAFADTISRCDESVLTRGKPLLNQLEMVSGWDGRRHWCLTNRIPLSDESGENRLVVQVSRFLPNALPSGEQFSKISAGFMRMKEFFAQPLRVEHLAKDSGLSMSQFERLVKVGMRLTPRQLIVRYRVDAAADLLRTSDLSAGEIAPRCGFCDQPYFTKLFKKTTGVSPHIYRKIQFDMN